jgi:hypothetical protein
VARAAHQNEKTMCCPHVALLHGGAIVEQYKHIMLETVQIGPIRLCARFEAMAPPPAQDGNGDRPATVWHVAHSTCTVDTCRMQTPCQGREDMGSQPLQANCTAPASSNWRGFRSASRTSDNPTVWATY